MKQYIKGKKKLAVTKSRTHVRFDFDNGKIVTSYFKPVHEYQDFLDYMLNVWFNVKRGEICGLK